MRSTTRITRWAASLIVGTAVVALFMTADGLTAGAAAACGSERFGSAVGEVGLMLEIAEEVDQGEALEYEADHEFFVRTPSPSGSFAYFDSESTYNRACRLALR